MAEVFESFDDPVSGRDGRSYTARACGREIERGRWEGWIEFTPADGDMPLRTRRETTQPNRADLEYWAGGLRPTYLEGALERALAPRMPPEPRPIERPAFDAPAPEPRPVAAAPVRTPPPHAILDPFAVYAEVGDVLHDQLMALSPAQLRNIALAYSLAPEPEGIQRLTKPELAAFILDAVALRAGQKLP